MRRLIVSVVVFILVVGASIWLQYHFPEMKEAVLTVLGAFIALGGSWFFTSRDNEKAARYLAIRVVCVLDKFMEDCLAVVTDDGLCYGQRTPEGYKRPQVDSPGSPVYPDDVDWKSIDHDLMYEILSFPSDVEAGDNAISFIWRNVATEPDFDEYFETRAFRYAQLGLKVSELVEKLRRKYGIKPKTYDNWNPVAELKKELEKMQSRRNKQGAV
jgi:hypothetical protein